MNILMIHHKYKSSVFSFCEGWRGKREEGETLRCLQVDDDDADGVHGDSDVDGDVDVDVQVGVSSWMLEGRGSLQ